MVRKAGVKYGKSDGLTPGCDGKGNSFVHCAGGACGSFFFSFSFFFLTTVVAVMMGAGRTHYLANKCVQTSYYPNHLFVGFPMESSAHLETKEG